MEIISIFAPFIVTASCALVQVGYESGFGELNASDFCMVEVWQSKEHH